MQDMQRWNDVSEALAVESVPSDDFVATSFPRPIPVSARQQRRLPDRILVAAHQACDLDELDVAASLLSILELVLMQPGGSLTAHRRVVEGAVAAYERLWHLRRARDGQADPSEASTSFRPSR